MLLKFATNDTNAGLSTLVEIYHFGYVSYIVSSISRLSLSFIFLELKEDI